jgi:hypothetical protein
MAMFLFTIKKRWSPMKNAVLFSRDFNDNGNVMNCMALVTNTITFGFISTPILSYKGRDKANIEG